MEMKIDQSDKCLGRVDENSSRFWKRNIEFIEFWLQDPFIKNTANPTGGKLYFNIGNISEDILRDGKRLYKGLPHNPFPVDTNTVWGEVPSNPTGYQCFQ
jgi:cell surface protein SprA